MFNLLKVKWHTSNVYSMKQAIGVLNAVENVTTIETGLVHVDYASLFDGGTSNRHQDQFKIITYFHSVVTQLRMPS